MKSVVIAIHLISFGQVILNLVSAQSYRAALPLCVDHCNGASEGESEGKHCTDLSILARTDKSLK